MALKAEVIIDAPREDVWKVITDIKNSADFISGIEKVEVLEDPKDNLVGFKWEETRTMFGQTAKEIMWITDAEENHYYRTRAERPNVIYISNLSVEDKDQSTKLTMGFEAETLSLGTRLLSAISGIFFNKATRNALQQDLEDIKAHVEGS